MALLREWRRQEAADQKLPAYCVFTDATLIAIAEARPRSTGELVKVQGLGPTKADGTASTCWRSSLPRRTVRDHLRDNSRIQKRPGSRAAGLDERTSRHAFRLRVREEGSGYNARSSRAERAIKHARAAAEKKCLHRFAILP